MTGVVIALLAAIAAPAAAQTVLAPGETLVQVEATGRVTAVPDRATIGVGVTTVRPGSAEAASANAAQADRLIAALRRAGVPDAAIRTSEVTLQPEHRRTPDGDEAPGIAGYRAANRLQVTISDVARTAAVLDALIAAGANDVAGPRFAFADEAPLLARARRAAVRQARAQADDYAAALGLTVARVVRVSERSAGGRDDGGAIVVTASRAKAPPIRPGEQDVRVTVWIDYALATR